MNVAPHIMIIESRECGEVVDHLVKGAIAELELAGASHERFAVPGVGEIPASIRFAVRSMELFRARRRFDGYLALGCGIVCDSMQSMIYGERLHALHEVILRHTLAVGQGIVIASTMEEAQEKARPDAGNMGGWATRACLEMIDLKRQLRLFPRQA